MTDLNLTIALERYDRHVPFFMGLVEPRDGLSLTPFEVGMAPLRRDGNDRHRRFLQDKEFDLAETSFSSHIIATSRGEPFVGIPVFPRRLFSQNHFFINAKSGIEKPEDLAGRPVIVRTLQTTMSVLALGDLKFEYGVPWEDIHWVTAIDEVLPIAAREGVVIERAGVSSDEGVGRLLLDGEVDAMIYPHPPPNVLEAGDAVRPLFADRKAEALRYYRKYGYYPIMHLIAVQRQLIDDKPWIAKAVMDMWNDAKFQARDFYEDPGYAELAFARNEFESQQKEMGDDPWTSGFKANYENLERFIKYSYDQKLIDAPIAPESLFHESTLDT